VYKLVHDVRHNRRSQVTVTLLAKIMSDAVRMILYHVGLRTLVGFLRQRASTMPKTATGQWRI